MHDGNTDNPASASRHVMDDKSIKQTLVKIRQTNLWQRCTNQTHRKLERYMHELSVPDGVNDDTLYGLYTAQGYLNGAYMSAMVKCETEDADAVTRARHDCEGIVHEEYGADIEKAMKPVGGMPTMMNGFDRGFSDGMDIVNSKRRGKGMTTDDADELCISAITGALVVMMHVDGSDDGDGDIEDDAKTLFIEDAYHLVTQCIGDAKGIDHAAGMRCGLGYFAAGRIGMRTNDLHHAVESLAPMMRRYVTEKVLPAHRVSAEITEQYAANFAFGFLRDTMFPSIDDDDAPLVDDVISETMQPSLREYVRIGLGDGYNDGAIYDVMDELASALEAEGLRIDTANECATGRSIANGIIAAYKTNDGWTER